jgi:hypothetical protein
LGDAQVGARWMDEVDGWARRMMIWLLVDAAGLEWKGRHGKESTFLFTRAGRNDGRVWIK